MYILNWWGKKFSFELLLKALCGKDVITTTLMLSVLGLRPAGFWGRCEANLCDPEPSFLWWKCEERFQIGCRQTVSGQELWYTHTSGKEQNKCWGKYHVNKHNVQVRKHGLFPCVVCCRMPLGRIRAFTSLSRSCYLLFCPSHFLPVIPDFDQPEVSAHPDPPSGPCLHQESAEEGRSQQNKGTWSVSAKRARWGDDARLSLSEHLVSHPCSSIR